MRKLAYLLICAIFLTSLARADIVWPTPSKAFANGEPYPVYIQPTVSGKPESGLFGDVRSSGWKFHEGIDIAPVSRNRKGEALDDIYAAMNGKVVLINRIAGNSGYGRYIVMEHSTCDVPVYTLYAHLAEIDGHVAMGAQIKAGERLGRMGRSARYSIARAQSHLHFEMGLRLSNHFDKWYRESKRFKEKNFFGNYNGINLAGFDPLDFLNKARNGEINNGFKGYIQSLPVALVVRVYTKRTPDFVKNYPMLVDQNGTKYGWDISLTWFGMPVKMERVKNPRAGARESEVEIVKYNPEELTRKCKGKRFIEFDRKGGLKIRDELKDLITRIFP